MFEQINVHLIVQQNILFKNAKFILIKLKNETVHFFVS